MLFRSCISWGTEPRNIRDWKGRVVATWEGVADRKRSCAPWGTILCLLVKLEATSDWRLILGARMGFSLQTSVGVSVQEPWEWQGPPQRYR